jgi:transcription elongation factor GreA
MKTVQLTQEGFDNIQKELNELITVKRHEAVERLQKARAMGDLRENSEYSAAKEDLSFIEGRVQELEMLIENAEIMTASTSGNGIQIGCSVIIEKDGKNEEYAIVGEFEANPIERKLSTTSPIGKALQGKKVGETVTVEVPAGKLIYKIVEIKKS